MPHPQRRVRWSRTCPPPPDGDGSRPRPLARPRAAASRGMSGRQGAESGRGRDGGDATPEAGISVGEVATEAPRGPVEVAGPDRQGHEGDAIAVRGQVPPGRAEDAELGELLLA